MKVVDAQVHVNRFPTDWRTVDTNTDTVLEAAIAAMDAVGIDAVLLAEDWGWDDARHTKVLPNGAKRPDLRFSRRATERFPARFQYQVRIDLRDPEPEEIIARIRHEPGALCLRVVPLPHLDEDLFKADSFEPLFDAAEQYSVPIFVGMPGQAALLERYLKDFPKLWLILDHVGVGVTASRGSQLPPHLQSWVTPTLEGRLAELDFIIGLAKYPNLAIKWSNAPTRLSAEEYPHRDAVRHLRRVIAAFGVERVMWASDYTESRAFHTWAQSLHYLRYSELLSEVEKEWLLGKTVRRILQWPGQNDFDRTIV